ncbi:hypothetical protein JCM19236_3070 [Vibrio sp. JCM 19236]|nr:hypothetical protein JCM19236_3070 [Vibrio sp. JCM 19236]
MVPAGGELHLEILVDAGSVEFLINRGEFSFTNLAFAQDTEASCLLEVNQGELHLQNLTTKSLAGEEE